MRARHSLRKRRLVRRVGRRVERSKPVPVEVGFCVLRWFGRPNMPVVELTAQMARRVLAGGFSVSLVGREHDAIWVTSPLQFARRRRPTAGERTAEC
jgi:hypothetical protein